MSLYVLLIKINELTYPAVRKLRSRTLLTVCTGCKVCRPHETYVHVRF